MRGTLDMAFARQYMLAHEDLSKVTVVIACKDGEDVIGNTIKDLKTKFRPRQIVVVSNGSTDRTCDIVREEDAICVNIKKPIGKVRAINFAIPYVRTPYVLLLDDDTLLKGALVPTELLDKGYAGVAFRVHVKKSSTARNNWVSEIQAHEYRKSSDIGKRRHNKHAAVQNISGAVGLYTRKELLRQIQLHTGEFSGEDLQRTLLLHLAADPDNKGVVLSDSIVYTEAPASFSTLYRQRVYGWFPGQYANFTNYLRILFSRHAPLGLREDAFYNIFLVMFMDIIRVLALPIMIFYPWYFVVMYVAYIFFETLAWFKNGHSEPYWVVLVYPFYGVFGLLTRVGAFATFWYRRLVAKLSHSRYFDDYRQASKPTKLASACIVTLFFGATLGLNIQHNFSREFTDINLERGWHDLETHLNF
jgi:cellulose synthase/poly-beta-1,6-N-acetylglucosamine synthase-like glycosyltransferase